MNENLYEKNYEDRIEDIKNNLYIGGGIGQAISLMSIMLSPYSSKDFGHSDIDPDNILSIIGNQIKELRRTVRNGGIIPIKIFETMFSNYAQKHMAYACLDKNLKFCVKHYQDEDWKDILYVFPYMNCTTAYDVTCKYDNIFSQDI